MASSSISGSSNRNGVSYTTQIRQAEREAAKQIESSQKRIKDANQEAAKQIDKIKQDADQQILTETLKKDDLIEKEHQEGYEQIRDVRREFDRQVNQTKREGEQELARAKGYYRDTLYNTHLQGDEELRQTEKKASIEMDLARKRQANQYVSQQLEQRQNEENLRSIQEDKTRALTEEYNQEYEQKLQSTNEQKIRASELLEARYQNLQKEHDEILGNLYQRASDEIQHIKSSTAMKLDAYSSRKSDPFYQMVTTDARLHDNGDDFVLTATIPKHEQGSISLAIEGNNLVLKGSRRNQDVLVLENGEKQATSSYQSFQQSFPLDYPVIPKLLTKYFDGETLTVRIPKQSLSQREYDVAQQAEKTQKAIARISGDRPHFPREIEVLTDPKPNPEAGSKDYKPIT